MNDARRVDRGHSRALNFPMTIRTRRVLLVGLVAAAVALASSDCDATRAVLETRVPREGNLQDFHDSELSCDRSETTPSCCPPTVRSALATWAIEEFGYSIERAVQEAFRPQQEKAEAIEGLVKALLKDGQRLTEKVLRDSAGFPAKYSARLVADLFLELERLHPADARTFYANLCEEIVQAVLTSDALNRRCSLRETDLGARVLALPERATSTASSLLALETFASSLRTGYSLARTATGAKAKVSPDCLSALFRMRSCPVCAGRPDVKPCKNFCLDVMDICLGDLSTFNSLWKRLADVTIKLADQISGRSFEQDVFGLDDIISKELKNFVNEVKQQCGAAGWKGPPLDPEEALISKEKLLLKGSDLEMMVGEAKELVKLTKGFWADLPFVMCSNLTNYNPNLELFFDSEEPESLGCWTGSTVGKYNVDGKTTSHNIAAASSVGLVQDQIWRMEKIIHQPGFHKNLRSLGKQKREDVDSSEGSGEARLGDDEDDLEGSGPTTSPNLPTLETTTPQQSRGSRITFFGAILTILLLTCTAL